MSGKQRVLSTGVILEWTGWRWIPDPPAATCDSSILRPANWPRSTRLTSPEHSTTSYPYSRLFELEKNQSAAFFSVGVWTTKYPPRSDRGAGLAEPGSVGALSFIRK